MASTARRRTTLTSRLQSRLTSYYGLDQAPHVDDFVRTVDDPSREELLVRESEDGLELVLHLPRSALAAGSRASLDQLCQVVEGVSHFVFLAERARRELPATQLELELQAEVDKYVMLVAEGVYSSAAARPRTLASAPARAAALRARLFDGVRYAHPAGTEPGDRYRLANDLAARFARRLEADFARRGRFDQMRAVLRRFYRAGQTEKIELARAA